MGTREQALTALQRANRVRQERARMKAEFVDRELSPIAVINDCPDYVATMPVDKFVTAVPRIGVGKAREILRRCHIAAGAELGKLTDRQRLALAKEIKDKGWL